MLLIPCPHCGPRAETEFAYRGDAGIRRPADPAALSDAEWTAYVYLRENPRGTHAEYWLHRSGCRRWLRVERDTATHRVLSVSDAKSAAAGEPG